MERSGIQVFGVAGRNKMRSFLTDALVVCQNTSTQFWTLPSGDSDYPGRWCLIDGRFTDAVAKAGVGSALSRNVKGEYNLWQRRYWEHTIRDEDDLRLHVD